MKIAPRAKIDDGLLDVVIVKKKISKFKLLKLFPKVFTGEHINDSIIEYYQTKGFNLETRKKMDLNIDGEKIGTTPIQVNMIPKAISIYYD